MTFTVSKLHGEGSVCCTAYKMCGMSMQRERTEAHSELAFNSAFQFQPFKIFLNWGSSLCFVFSLYPEGLQLGVARCPECTFNRRSNLWCPPFSILRKLVVTLNLRCLTLNNPVMKKCMIVSPAVLLIQLTHILVCANSKDVIYIHYISQQTAGNLAGQELVTTSWCNDAAHQLVYSHLSPLLRLTESSAGS